MSESLIRLTNITLVNLISSSDMDNCVTSIINFVSYQLQQLQSSAALYNCLSLTYMLRLTDSGLWHHFLGKTFSSDTFEISELILGQTAYPYNCSK